MHQENSTAFPNKWTIVQLGGLIYLLKSNNSLVSGLVLFELAVILLDKFLFFDTNHTN